jgi:transcriptional regulator with XRE-family HTH domain
VSVDDGERRAPAGRRASAARRPTRLRQQAVGAQVRKLRKRGQLSLRGLAASTGFSPSFVSQLERGLVSPSLHSMERVATALGTTLAGFFTRLGEADAGQIVRASDRTVLQSAWSLAQLEALWPAGSTPRLEPLLLTLRPRGRSGKHPVALAAEQFAFVLAGRPQLRLGPDEYALRPGDAIGLRPGELRLWTNPGRKPARVLIVVLRER